jgi:hypothetical protein
MVDTLKLHELRRPSSAGGGVNNHKTFSFLASYGFAEMGEAGIKIDTITLFDDVFPVSVKKLHRSLEKKEDLFAFVLMDRFLLRLKRKGQDEGVHLLIREGMGNGLIRIIESGAPGD